jgi:O-antigen ligase
MNNSYPSFLSNEKPLDWPILDGPVTPDQPVKNELEFQGKLLPAICVGIYFICVFPPPIWPIQNLRWYMALGLALFAFLVQKKSLNPRAASVFWVVAGLNFLGALVSLLRANSFDLALWSTVGFGSNILIFLLFLPTISTRLARQFLLLVLIGTSIVWSFEIQRDLNLYGTSVVFAPQVVGWDKNKIGDLLNLGVLSLFFLAVIWKPTRRMPAWLILLIRIGLGAVGLYLLYYLSVLYDRSGVLLTFVGIGMLLVLSFTMSPSRWSGLLRTFIAAAIITIIILLFMPKVLEVSPRWNRLGNISSQGLSAISTYEIRMTLIRKALFLVSENPFLGIGIGGTRQVVTSAYVNYPGFYIHNNYLTEWAEKGILAILSYIIWLFVYLKFLRRKFLKVPPIDQLWLFIIGNAFITGFFADNNTVLLFMVIIFSGIYYEQYQKEQSKMAADSVAANEM